MASATIAPGDTFGRLTVVEQTGRNKHGVFLWLCRCSCGGSAVVSRLNLRAGTLSCGCYRLGLITKHGLSHLPEYSIWREMRSRCSSKGRINYKHYGGRGITVCARWQDFSLFLADVGPRPSIKHQIDRIDNDGNYEPGNVRWTTATENLRNTRQNVRLTHNGETHCLSEWAALRDISPITLATRLRRGWTVADAIETPVRR